MVNEPEQAEKEPVSTLMYRMGMLLQKGRSPLKTRLVEAVVRDALSTEEKINRIVAIDLKPETPEKPEPRHQAPSIPRNAPARQAAPPEPATPSAQHTPRREAIVERIAGTLPIDKPSLKAAHRARLHLFRNPEHAGIFRYLFLEYRRILRFGESTRMLRRGLLPFTLRLSSAPPVLIRQTLREDIAPTLRSLIAPVLQQGWLFLERRQYNAAAALQALCGSLAAIEYPEGKHPETALSAAMVPAASLLLFFIHDESMARDASEAILRTCERLAIAEENRSRAPALIRELFGTDPFDTSPCNLVRALAMLVSRRWVELDDLAVPVDQAALPGDVFDCDDSVQEKIDLFVARQVTRLDGLDRERREMAWIRIFLEAPAPSDIAAIPPERGIRDDSDLLVRFDPLADAYRSDPVIPGLILEVDRKSIMLFSIRCVDVYLRIFEPLLSGGIRIGNDRAVKLFSQGSLQAQCDKLSLLRDALQKHASALSGISANRFDDLRRTPGLGAKTETQVVPLVTELGSTMTSVGNTIAGILRSRSTADAAIMGFRHDDGKVSPLPHETERLASPGFLDGKTVLAALKSAAGAAFLAGIVLGDGSVLDTLRREKAVREQIAETVAALRRLMVPSRFADLESSFADLFGSMDAGKDTVLSAP